MLKIKNNNCYPYFGLHRFCSNWIYPRTSALSFVWQTRRRSQTPTWFLHAFRITCQRLPKAAIKLKPKWRKNSLFFLGQLSSWTWSKKNVKCYRTFWSSHNIWHSAMMKQNGNWKPTWMGKKQMHRFWKALCNIFLLSCSKWLEPNACEIRLKYFESVTKSDNLPYIII